MKIRITRIIFLGYLLIGVFASGMAQPNPGAGGCDTPPCGGPGSNPNAPLGGIEILLAAGALFGAKKALDKKKSN